MKRNLVFGTALIAISLTAYGLNSKSEATFDTCLQVYSTPDFDFVYSVSTRFTNTIRKSVIDQAKTAKDILPAGEVATISEYHNIQLSTFTEDRKNEVKALSKNVLFTEDQLSLFKAMDCTSSFYITGNVTRSKDNRTTYDTLVYYMTVIPEQPAMYQKGEKAMLHYLKKNSREVIAVAEEDKTNPGKISFVVNTSGSIENVHLTFSSGYPSIDEKMLELIREMPGDWESARNNKGEAVDQELVFFFGKVGC